MQQKHFKVSSRQRYCKQYKGGDIPQVPSALQMPERQTLEGKPVQAVWLGGWLVTHPNNKSVNKPSITARSSNPNHNSSNSPTHSWPPGPQMGVVPLHTEGSCKQPTKKERGGQGGGKHRKRKEHVERIKTRLVDTLSSAIVFACSSYPNAQPEREAHLPEHTKSPVS